MPGKKYLGDGVYARIEFGQIILTTENGGHTPTNKIVLEIEVYDGLVEYVASAVQARLKQMAAEQQPPL